MNEDRSHLRRIPSVESILNLPEVISDCKQFGRTTVTARIREILSELRQKPACEVPASAEDMVSHVVQSLRNTKAKADSRRLRKVINATGIVIHTNLGRAPLARAAMDALIESATCTNLEVDLESGQRSGRGAAVEQLCQEITGAEAALVVNNCAAATLLTLQTLGSGQQVIISRGQLIEIGGSYRLPDVFRQAGVELREVGTTNRTRLSDYARAIGPQTAALLRVHPSNYRVTGFSESVGVEELVGLATKSQLPIIDDVGSGCLYDLTRYGLPDEPIVSASVKAGASLVLFSGDKLLGGPQCGVIVGRKDLVARLRSNPLARALRVDKLTLAALQATLEIHLAGRAFDEIPVLRQLTMDAEQIRHRAESLIESLRSQSDSTTGFALRSVLSASGGGALPDQSVPSWAIAISGVNPDHVARTLRAGSPSVFTRIQDGCVLIDLRTVLPEDEEALLRRLIETCSTTLD
jgi:L-seryl-tRNA(Ser) seleniumtransferase